MLELENVCPSHDCAMNIPVLLSNKSKSYQAKAYMCRFCLDDLKAKLDKHREDIQQG